MPGDDARATLGQCASFAWWLPLLASRPSSGPVTREATSVSRVRPTAIASRARHAATPLRTVAPRRAYVSLYSSAVTAAASGSARVTAAPPSRPASFSKDTPQHQRQGETARPRSRVRTAVRMPRASHQVTEPASRTRPSRARAMAPDGDGATMRGCACFDCLLFLRARVSSLPRAAEANLRSRLTPARRGSRGETANVRRPGTRPSCLAATRRRAPRPALGFSVYTSRL